MIMYKAVLLWHGSVKKGRQEDYFTCPQPMCRKVARDNFSQNTAKPIKGIRERMVENKLYICSVVSPGRSRHLNECMKVYDYRRSRSFLDLGPRLCKYKNSNPIFSETTVPI